MARSTSVPVPAPPAAQPPAPPFGGYPLVALVIAWLAGIAAHYIGPLWRLPAPLWLAVAGGCAALTFLLWLVGLRPTQGGWRGPGRRAMLLACMLGVLLALGAARATSADTTTAPDAIARLATGASIELQGIVAAEPDVRTTDRLLTVDVSVASRDGGHTWQPAAGRIEVTIYGPDDWFAPAYGDTLALTGKLQPVTNGADGPGVTAHLAGARATILARGGGNPLLAWLAELRVRLAQAVQRALPEPEAALLIGILFGLKTPTLRARLGLFTATGTIHLVVPAGLKVSVLAELATLATQPLGRWLRTVASLLAVGMYAALGGGGPAALRAAIMGALLVLAPVAGRAYNVFTALALAVLLMTAIEPLLLYDAGFQLTTLATLGLPLLVPPLARWLSRGLGWLPAGAAIAELLAVTLAAQLATLPVLALTFHQISLVAPLANLLTVPLLAPLLVLGGALALAAVLSVPVAGAVVLALGWLAWPLLWYVNAAIAACAGLPLAALAVPALPAVVALAYYAALAALVWGGTPLLRRLHQRGWVAEPPAALGGVPARATGHLRLGRTALAGLCALALLGACGAAAPALAVGSSGQLDFLAVGTGGAATLLRLPSGVTALIDGGPDGPTLEQALAGRLPFWQRALDLAVLTDARTGNARGLEDAAAHFTLGQAADGGMAHPTTEYLAWRDAVMRAGAPYTRVRAGMSIRLDATSVLRVLSPPQELFPPNEGDTTASDDLILRLEMPGLRVLLLGSADAYALDALAGAAEPLGADVVALALPPDAPLDLAGPLGAVLTAAHPRLVVICDAPEAPTSVSARRAAVSDWQARDAQAAQTLGAMIVRTSAAGTVSLSGGARGWSLAN